MTLHIQIYHFITSPVFPLNNGTKIMMRENIYYCMIIVIHQIPLILSLIKFCTTHNVALALLIVVVTMTTKTLHMNK